MNGQHTQPAMLGEHDTSSAGYSNDIMFAPAGKCTKVACTVQWYSSLTVLIVARTIRYALSTARSVHSSIRQAVYANISQYSPYDAGQLPSIDSETTIMEIAPFSSILPSADPLVDRRTSSTAEMSSSAAAHHLSRISLSLPCRQQHRQEHGQPSHTRGELQLHAAQGCSTQNLRPSPLRLQL